MPKTYYNPAKQPTIDVPVKLLSRGRAPLSSDEAIAGRHIDDLTCETDGVGALKKTSGRERDVASEVVSSWEPLII